MSNNHSLFKVQRPQQRRDEKVRTVSSPSNISISLTDSKPDARIMFPADGQLFRLLIFSTHDCKLSITTISGDVETRTTVPVVQGQSALEERIQTQRGDRMTASVEDAPDGLCLDIAALWSVRIPANEPISKTGVSVNAAVGD